MRWLILCLVCFVQAQLFAKVRILTFHCNHAELIELQYKTLKKFLLDDFELIVFNDAKTEENKQWIERVCKDNGVQCVRYQPEWHLTEPINAYLQKIHAEVNRETPDIVAGVPNQPSVRHGHVIQYALDHYGYDHDDIVVIMDGDHFIIDYLSIRELLRSSDIVGVNRTIDTRGEKRSRLQIEDPPEESLLWVVFTAFDPRKLPDIREMQFHTDVVYDHATISDQIISDTGAALHKYLRKHPSVKIQAYSLQRSQDVRQFLNPANARDALLIRLIDGVNPHSVQFFLLEHCLHLESVSWGGAHIDLKAQSALQFINDILKPNW